jgi:hypothetical protein
MVDLFKEIIPSILQTRNHVLETEEDEKSYTPFIVNKALSAHIDCLSSICEINRLPHLDNKMQYDYLFHSIKKYKRGYQKWVKAKENSKDLDLVMEYYKYSTLKAKEVLGLLSNDELNYIKDKLDKGGKCK